MVMRQIRRPGKRLVRDFQSGFFAHLDRFTAGFDRGQIFIDEKFGGHSRIVPFRLNPEILKGSSSIRAQLRIVQMNRQKK